MKERLYSLDVLRGLDMILLVVAGPIIKAADKVFHFSPAFMGQFKHGWEGFTLWDVIMPLFIFMCGAAIPFALKRRLVDGRAGVAFWRHVLSRVAVLWILGMVIQGNLLTLDPAKFNPYSNTLQAIAAGYFITACVMLIRSRVVRIAAPAVFALLYSLLLAFGGDYTQYGNFAYKTDFAILKALLPTDSIWILNPSQYTWFSTSLMFAAMTLVGLHATEILRSDMEKRRKAVWLFAYGVALEAVGWGVSPWIPVIKPIFTLSFTAQAMGWCVISLAVLYVITDIFMLRKGLGVVVLFGQYALTAYLVGVWFFRPVLKTLADILLQGFPFAFGLGSAEMQLVSALVVGCEITLVLLIRRRMRG